MIRVVLDTNVVVSALLNPRGKEASLLRIALAGGVAFYLTEPIFVELKTVLERPHFKFNHNNIAMLLNDIRSFGVFVTPSGPVTASSDEPDNRFLECAEAAKAHYVVTGNKKHFPQRWLDTEIVNARELLDIMFHV
jgi:putative PIN family toxin of toxin-antitoxin system